MRAITIISAIFAILSIRAAEQPDTHLSHQSVGLVLSGGGAKGIAHIGVIKALEENNIPIDYIAGTSMGAIVGSLYACGYTPEEMMALIKSPEFGRWSMGVTDERLTYYFSKPEQTPALITVPIGRTDSIAPSSILPHSFINPAPMNFGFMEIFSGYTAQCGGDFNRLFVPFRCVASDVEHKHKVVFAKGMLEDAVRASMSFPIVFRPIEVDGVPLYDGGIYDNFPVDVMRRDFSPSIIIGVDVHTPATGIQENDIMNQLETLIIQNNDYELPADEGIKIHVNASRYSLLDFDKAPAIYALGYDKAVSMMDSIKGRITTRTPAEARDLARQVYKSRVPYVRFDSVNVSGGTSGQNEYIKYLFEAQAVHDTIGIDGARMAYYRALSPGRLSNLLPKAKYDPSSGLFDLSLKAAVKNSLTAGIGGYITTSSSNMLYLSGAYRSLSFSSIDAQLGIWLGQSYQAGAFTGDMVLRTATPSSIGVQVVASRHKFSENDRMFYNLNSPTFVTCGEVITRLRYQMAAGRNGKWTLAGGYVLSTRDYNTGADARRKRGRFDTGQLLGQYVYNTLDNSLSPTSGTFVKASVAGYTGKYRFRIEEGHGTTMSSPEKHTWGELSFEGGWYGSLGTKWALGGRVTGVYSTLGLLGNYYATVTNAPGFNPTPSSYDTFNPSFHANQYVTAGLVPMWMPMNNVCVKADLHGFMPMRRLISESDGGVRYGSWFAPKGLEFFGELSAGYSLQSATLRAYVNYKTGSNAGWGVGIAFGVFILAPGRM